MTQHVAVAVDMETVQKGTKYTGTVMIASRVFRYELSSAIPLISADSLADLAEDAVRRGRQRALRKALPISVENGEGEIALTDLDYGFFYMFLVGLVLPDLLTSGRSDYLEVQRIELEQQWIDVLSDPKFGCRFA